MAKKSKIPFGDNEYRVDSDVVLLPRALTDVCFDEPDAPDEPVEEPVEVETIPSGLSVVIPTPVEPVEQAETALVDMTRERDILRVELLRRGRQIHGLQLPVEEPVEVETIPSGLSVVIPTPVEIPCEVPCEVLPPSNVILCDSCHTPVTAYRFHFSAPGVPLCFVCYDIVHRQHTRAIQTP